MLSLLALPNLRDGDSKIIRVLRLHNGSVPVTEFLEALEDSELQEFYAGFQKIMSVPGWRPLGEWFKPMRNVTNIWQISSSNCRIWGFRHGECLALTHGRSKPKKEKQKVEIQKAEGFQDEFKRQERQER